MKVFYRYGAMNSAKTANLIMVNHNYVSRNRDVYVIKPSSNGKCNPLISTRAGLESIVANIIIPHSKDKIETVIEIIENQFVCNNYNAVLIDEAQFLLPEFIHKLIDLCNHCDIDILAYGLKTDYNNKLFEGTAEWLAQADRIEEIKTICDYCNHKAIFNKLMVKNNDNVIHLKKSDFRSVCRFHYNNSKTE